jgi:hypothetical protein
MSTYACKYCGSVCGDPHWAECPLSLYEHSVSNNTVTSLIQAQLDKKERERANDDGPLPSVEDDIPEYGHDET